MEKAHQALTVPLTESIPNSSVQFTELKLCQLIGAVQQTAQRISDRCSAPNCTYNYQLQKQLLFICWTETTQIHGKIPSVVTTVAVTQYKGINNYMYSIQYVIQLHTVHQSDFSSASRPQLSTSHICKITLHCFRNKNTPFTFAVYLIVKKFITVVGLD